jgi:hypothetical protein
MMHPITNRDEVKVLVDEAQRMNLSQVRGTDTMGKGTPDNLALKGSLVLLQLLSPGSILLGSTSLPTSCYVRECPGL